MKSFYTLCEEAEAAPGFWRRMGRAASAGFAKGWGTTADGRLRRPWPLDSRLGRWASDKWAEIRAKQRRPAQAHAVAASAVPSHGLLDYPSWQHGLTPGYNAASDYGKDDDADYLNIRRGVEAYLARGGVSDLDEKRIDVVTRRAMEEIEALRDPHAYLDDVLRHLRGA